MRIICYPLMCTRSKRAMIRIKGKFGHYSNYYPRETLVKRLSQELGLTKEQIIDQILAEREYLRQQLENKI